MATLTTLERIEESGVSVTLGGTQGPQGPRGDFPQTPSFPVVDTNIVLDASVTAYFRFTADQNFILESPSNAEDGQRIIIEITQDNVGGRIITLGNDFNTGSFTIILSSDPGAKDLLGLCWNQPDNEWMVLAFSKGY